MRSRRSTTRCREDRSRQRLRIRATAAVLAVVAWPPVASAQSPPDVEPSPELERLHFQLGDWLMTSQTLDAEGEVVAQRRSHATIRLEHDGLLLHILVTPEGGDEPVWRIWQFHGPYDGRLHDVSFDMAGHFEHRIEAENDGRRAFAFPEPRAFRDGVPRNWRKTYSAITDDSFVVDWDYSEDEENWTRIFHSVYSRRPSAVAGSRPDWAVEEMRATEGRWIADNSAYRSEQEPYDAYGIEWSLAAGDQLLEGRLFGFQNGEEVGTFWRFTTFWHPEKRTLWVQQIAASGAFGEGPLERTGEGSTQLEQTFYSPDGSIRRAGHRETEEEGRRMSQSFDIADDGTWTPRRSYVWVRQEDGGNEEDSP